MERVFVKQLMEHINSKHLDNPQQSAHKTGYSTETAILHLRYEIHLLLSHGKPTALVLLDLSTVFKTTNHDRLS